MRRFQALMCLAALILILFSSPSLLAQDETTWLLQQINCLRQSLGAPPLTLNVALTSAANEHSEDLAAHALTDFHVGLDGSTPTMRANSYGYTGSVGENVAWGRVAADALDFWLGSQIHYTNMTNEHWKDIGIGIGTGTRGTWYTLVLGATTWNVDPFTAAPCTLSDQLAPSVGLPSPVGLREAPTQGPPTPGSPTPTVSSLDDNGYIRHVIQPGENPGRVILMYGYAWEDLPRLMALNDMTDAEARQLNVGDIFLIPPRDGALMLTPGTSDEILLAVVTDTPSLNPTATLTATLLPTSPTPMPTATLTPLVSTALVSDVVTSTLRPASPTVITASPTSEALPTITLIPPVAFVASPTPIIISELIVSPPDNTSSILLVVVVVQQIIIVGMIAAWRIGRWRDSL